MMISIVVPVYNVEEYLSDCIDSLLKQSYQDIEILLVDDGSTDHSPQICDQYRRKDPRVEVIHKENGGLSDARNCGLLACHGDYVLYIDSDDWISTEACEKFAACLQTVGSADIVIGRVLNEDGSYYSKTSGAAVNRIYTGPEYYVRFQKSIISCAVASLYRRDFLLNNQLFFPVGKYHEDMDFTNRAYLAAEKIVFSGNDFYFRRIRAESITQKKDKRKNLLDVLSIGQGLMDLSQSIEDPAVRITLLDRICRHYLSLFCETDVFQYTQTDYSPYIDKIYVRKCAKSPYNRFCAALFILSPRLYIQIRKMKKNIRN